MDLGSLDEKTRLVLEVAAHDHDEVNQRPDPECPEGHELEQAGSDLPYVEAVNSQGSEKEAEQNRGNESLVTEATRRRVFPMVSAASMRSHLSHPITVGRNL